MLPLRMYKSSVTVKNCQLLRKLNITLIYDPAILLLRYIHQRTENRYSKTNIGTGKFKAALFTIAKRWKHKSSIN